MRCWNERSRNRRSRFQARRSALRPADFPLRLSRSVRQQGNDPQTAQELATRINPIWAAVLQRNNIHIKVCPEGEVTATLAALRRKPRHRPAESQVHPRHRRQDLRGRKPRRWRDASPATMPTFPTISASSCRWPASPPSSRSAKTPSTSRPPAASTGSTSSC